MEAQGGSPGINGWDKPHSPPPSMFPSGRRPTGAREELLPTPHGQGALCLARGGLWWTNGHAPGPQGAYEIHPNRLAETTLPTGCSYQALGASGNLEHRSDGHFRTPSGLAELALDLHCW